MENSMFKTVLERKDIDSEAYIDVFEKCKNDFIKLSGEEYHIGSHLHEFGLMQIRRDPIWINKSYRGVTVYFKSVTNYE